MPEKKLDDIVKALTIGVAVAYAVGMMISNGYLASLGVADFDPFRPRAILTGILFLVLISVAFFAEDSVDGSLKRKDLPKGWAGANALFVFLGAVAFYFVILAICESQHPAKVTTVLAVSVGMYLFPATALVEIRNVKKEWKRRASTDHVAPTSTAFMIFSCLSGLVGVVLFSLLFVKYVYLFVPPQFGGAKPRVVNIVVNDVAAQALNDLTIPMKRNTVDGKVELIHENSDSVAFRLPGGKTVVLARSEVVAVQAN